LGAAGEPPPHPAKIRIPRNANEEAILRRFLEGYAVGRKINKVITTPLVHGAKRLEDAANLARGPVLIVTVADDAFVPSGVRDEGEMPQVAAVGAPLQVICTS